MINLEQITLISEPYYGFTNPIVNDRVIKTFIHKSSKKKNFVIDMLSYAENLIGADFKLVKKQKNAELTFYETPLVADNPNYLGLAVPYESSSGNKWNLYIKSNTSFSKKWIYLHEFGHFLGMEHPFDDTDGDVWYGETTNDTVMSYNYQPNLYWWFRRADIDAITGMWDCKTCLIIKSYHSSLND